MQQESDRFLSAFNAVEQHLRELLEASGQRTFSELLHDASHRHALVKRLSGDLRHLAELRNFLVHGFHLGGPLAVPSHVSLQKIERIRDALLQPASLHSMFHKVVVCCHPEDKVGRVAELMHEHDFSQLPIYAGTQFIGLLTSDTLARWLAASLATGVGLVEEQTVAEILKHQDVEHEHRFASHKSTVTEAFGWLEKRYHKGQQLHAVILSPHGKETELPTGIVTSGDFPAMLEAVGL